MPNLWDWLLGGQQPPVFPQGQQPQPPFNPQQMAIAPTFAQAPQMAQDIAQGIAQPLLNAGNYLGGIMQGSQQFSWPETIQHGAALAMAMAPGPKGERVAGAVERGLAGAAESAAPAGIRAYHGSPYDFNQFDLSKIGTGEGAQAYGHGLYFAEREGTAKSYRDALSQSIGNQQTAAGAADRFVGAYGDDAADAIRREIATMQNQAQKLREAGKGIPQVFLDRIKNEYEPALEMINKGYKPGGKMYEVNIKAHPEQFLDWDKPFGEQSPAVQKAITDLWVSRGGTLEGRTKPPFVASTDTGEAIHAAMATTLGRGGNTAAQAAATEALHQAGIPGIRYLDQGSRGAGQGTHNYVVFNDQLIDILKKYGLAGMLGAGAAAPYFPQQPQQQ